MILAWLLLGVLALLAWDRGCKEGFVPFPLPEDEGVKYAAFLSDTFSLYEESSAKERDVAEVLRIVRDEAGDGVRVLEPLLGLEKRSGGDETLYRVRCMLVNTEDDTSYVREYMISQKDGWRVLFNTSLSSSPDWDTEPFVDLPTYYRSTGGASSKPLAGHLFV